jgi:hypothetical protein
MGQAASRGMLRQKRQYMTTAIRTPVLIKQHTSRFTSYIAYKSLDSGEVSAARSGVHVIPVLHKTGKRGVRAIVIVRTLCTNSNSQRSCTGSTYVCHACYVHYKGKHYPLYC